MFQPQPTPYSSFSSYGVGNIIPDFNFQPPGLVVDSGGPTVFRDPTFSPVANGLPYNNPILQFKMAGNSVSDLEAQEALARGFQPALEGSLVGEKKSSHAITEEYAKADPIYVAKTAALPQKYSHYRPILGDGNCGWRAAGFSYFETLLRLGNKAQLEEEITRLTSLNNLLTTVGGFQKWLFEDMVEETTTLLKDIANSIQVPAQPAAMDLLLRRFNDAEISNAIVYHFRLLASSWLKASPASYQDFIPDGIGVEGYCKDFLEPPNQEIDHLGMTLLIDVLLKPIGFAVEIVYLDRSEGTQVNSHVIRPEDSNGVSTNPGGPIIHLLYRPSHYDILYKERDTPLPVRQLCLDEATSNPNIQVNRATTFSQLNAQSTTSSMNDFANLDLTNLLSIPGFSLPPQPSHHGFPQQYPPVAEYTPSPTSSYPPAPTTASISPISLDTSSASTNFPPSSTLPIHPLPERPAPSSNATSSFRPSKYEWEAAADWQDTPTPTFQTSTFKNSHYNTAHYNNPNFQPEEWSPESEEVVGSRKRSS